MRCFAARGVDSTPEHRFTEGVRNVESRTLSVVSRDDRPERIAQTPIVALIARRPHHPSIFPKLAIDWPDERAPAPVDSCFTHAPQEDSCR